MCISHSITTTICIVLMSLSSVLFAQPSNHDTVKRNSVFVEQIGNQNVMFTEIASQQGRATYIQLGHRNEIQFQIKAKTLNSIILQKGVANNILNVQNNSKSVMQTTFIQTGQHQNLFMLGANSLSEKMTIRMHGNRQTLLVRNIRRRR